MTDQRREAYRDRLAKAAGYSDFDDFRKTLGLLGESPDEAEFILHDILDGASWGGIH